MNKNVKQNKADAREPEIRGRELEKLPTVLIKLFRHRIKSKKFSVQE